MNQSQFSVHNLPPWAADLMALLAGASLVLGFAPFSQAWIAPFALAVLFGVWLRASPRRAAWRGWLFGAGLFGGGVYWVYFSMHIYGQLPPILAGLFTVIMALLLALTTGLAGWLAVRLSPDHRPMRLLLVFPAVWVVFEWLRSWFLTGFPWLYVGYTQVDFPLGRIAPVLGVYGVSWALTLSAGLMVLLLTVSPRGRIAAAVALVGLWAGSWTLGLLHWTVPAGAPLKVSLLQPNVAQMRKWDPAYRRQIMSQYIDMTRAHWASDLIVWPETAVPVFYDQVENGYLDVIAAEARRHHTSILMGLPVRMGNDIYYNSVLSLGTRTFYHKRHLVPFGEYIPLRSLLGTLLDILQVPMSNFSSGADDQSPLPADGYGAGISICYEIAFPQEVRSFLPQAAWLVNLSNNTWFGDSSAPHQVLQMAQMRAMESGRYVLSATNDGVTAIINERGRVLRQAPQFKVTVLDGALQPRRGATPYVRYGDWPVLLTSLSAWLIGWRVVATRRRRGKSG